VTWLQLGEPDSIGRIRVGPLSLGGLHALFSARLGRSFARSTMVRIAEICGGNPLYALELARAIHVGSGNRDVAAALFISPKTVEANLGRIYRKLGIKTRAELGGVIDDL
jgi:Bacterial regulatory proteins, luxR family